MEKYPHSVFRVEINYLSQDYDDSMLATSSPYGNDLEKAEKAYNDALRLFCVDIPTKPARVTLTETVFSKPYEYGKTKTLKQNY